MFCLRTEFKRQRGAALVVALLVFAIAAALMVGLQREFTLQLRRVSSTLQQEQAWHYLRGAEDLAKTALRLDARQDQGADTATDNLQEIWAQESTTYPLPGGGWLAGEIEDLGGRFNLNNLIEGEQASEEASIGGLGAAGLTIHQRQFVRLLLSLENIDLDEQGAMILAEKIADYIDPDGQARSMGDETEAYRNAQPSYRPANRPMASVTELRAVSGMTEPVYRALAPYVTVWPAGGGALNVLTAPVTLLRTLNADTVLQPLSALDAENLALGRADNGWQSLEQLLTETLLVDFDLQTLRPVLTERSSWFLLTARVEIADTEQRLYSVIERDGDTLITRYRSMGEL